MLDVDVQHDREFVFNAVAHARLQADLLRYGLAVPFVQHVVLLRPHGADDVRIAAEDLLDERILPRRDLRPVREGVAHEACMVVEKIVPALGDRIDDDDLHPRTFAYSDGVDVVLRAVVRKRKHVIPAQAGVEVRASVLGIDDRDPAPVLCDAVREQKCGEGLSAARGALESHLHFGSLLR